MRKSRAVALDGFNTGEAARLSGASPRQLQWWDERGIVVPDRNRGKHRLIDRVYRRGQVLEARLVVELRRKGLPLGPIRKAVRAIQAMRPADRETGYLIIGADWDHQMFWSPRAQLALDRAALLPCAAIVVSLTELVSGIN